jgi:hypothetical protein
MLLLAVKDGSNKLMPANHLVRIYTIDFIGNNDLERTTWLNTGLRTINL